MTLSANRNKSALKLNHGVDVAEVLEPAGGPRQVNDVEYLGREAVLEILGVRKETLYTYVSRGLIKTMAQPGLKTKLYRKSDVEKLKTRAVARSDVPRVSHSLRYGAPIAPTWITEITPQGPRYRGHLATDLALQGRSFESVAELLWGGIPRQRSAPWAVASLPRDLVAWLDDAACNQRQVSTLTQFALIATRLSAMELGGGDAPSVDLLAGRRLLQAFAGVAGRLGQAGSYSAVRRGESIAEGVARGFGFERNAQATSIINVALVLSADHELSAPTFAARICASTGADLPACVAAALMAQSGPMQIGGAADVEALVASLKHAAGQGRTRAVKRLDTTAGLPCFDHPLYDRDPRAVVLLDLARRFPNPMPVAAAAFRLVEEAERSGQYPNLFAALVITAATLGLPNGSGALLHTLGRTAGWVAHAVEQQLAGAMLRPRAKYMGPSVGAPS